ncbi:MAG: asparagine synthase (glutamine-hydrolyzing) [Acidobacteria bacterium]|nr:asparagine synthase (glutamine-hydrolyzing) [Acidobacteriota bacterium]
MCGIAGVLTESDAPGSWLAETTARMTSRIAHRGPDHADSWNDGAAVCLGYRRLAIVDLSPDGNQPRVARGGRLALVFNGEIYNFVEIRDELARAGALFRGRSDTEVLLAAIDRWGLEPALARAAGMFAFALWDADARRLALVRDRAGKKPLYYCRSGGVWYFASEIKALRSGVGLSPDVNVEALHDYLSLGYVPGDRTICRDIEQAPAGAITFLARGRPPHAARYWQLPAPDEHAAPADLDDELDRLLTLAVQQRLRADVEVGLFLSGGIDSSLIAATAARASDRPLNMFTVAFDDEAFDESEPASRIAALFGGRHEVLRLSADARDTLPAIAAAYDEPFADPSAVPTFAVAKAAGRRLKVVLNGEGADELFGGYRRQVAIDRLARAEPLLRVLPGLSALARALPRPAGFRTPYSLAYRMLRGIDLPPAARYIVWSSDGFTEEEKGRLMPGRSCRPTAGALAAEAGWPLDRGTVGDFMSLDFVYGLGDCLLVKMDIATMAHGLEARSPFLDHRLVELVARLPRRTVFAGGGTKPILRRMARRYLPSDIVEAPKRGFEIPLARWMSGELRPMMADSCLDPSGIVAEVMDRTAVRDFVDRRWPIDDERWAKCAWILLMLALWDRYARGASPAPAPEPAAA